MARRLPGGTRDAFAHLGAGERIAVEVGLDGIDGGRQRQCAEEAEERAQLVLGDEAVHERAARRREHDGLAGEGAMVDEIEEMLQRARHRGAIDGCADDEEIGALDLIDDATRLAFQLPRMKRGE